MQVRHFLGWDRPLCETVPERLLEGRPAGTVDLRGTVIVTPTRQSCWRLRAALPLTAHARGIVLLGPEIVTAPALLQPPPLAGRATPLQTLLAWCAAVAEVPAGELQAFLGQSAGGTVLALPLARRLQDLRRELADGALDIGRVARIGGGLEEADRWVAMADLERRYLAKLAAWKLRDPICDQLAHADKGQLADVSRVVLAALPDPPQLLLRLLGKWSDTGGRVEAWVAAPKEEASSFDPWGRPRTDVWNRREIALNDADLLLNADPEEHAARIAALVREGLARATAGISTLAPLLRPAVAVGVPDREAIAPLKRQLAAIGFAAFDPQNLPFSNTPLFRLIEALLAWQRRPAYAETAVLLRHPDVLAALRDPARVLEELDALQALRLPVTFDELAAAARAAGKSAATLAAALATLEDWRARLANVSLAAGLRAALQAVYAARQLRADSLSDRAFRQAASELDEALRELAPTEPLLAAGSDAAEALLARLQDVSIRPERAEEPLDLEGWLELAWNPCPILAVAGLNEGLVPDSRVGDLFLPDSLRRELDLRDDQRRVARDAYLLTVLAEQRRAHGRLLLLVGKTALNGDPLRPSRLLFHCGDDELVARAQRLFRQPPPIQNPAPFQVGFKLQPARVPPNEVRASLGARMSPTTFRDYLACPLRFYLRHGLRMEPVDDTSREPDPRAFGELVHAVLDAMAAEKLGASGDATRLGDWLEERLRQAVQARYGGRPWLGVTLAAASAARRLRAFAAQQVQWHTDGWEILASERSGFTCRIDGTIVGGRIDRIDRNRRDGRICVLDYKTADAAKPPDQTHLAPGEEAPLPEAVIPPDLLPARAGKSARRPRHWVDLQLPLYRELLRPQYGPDVQLGYVLLPATLGDTAFVRWDGYHDALHAHAIACARAIAARVRNGIFWPPASRTPPNDDFSSLLFDDAAAFVEKVEGAGWMVEGGSSLLPGPSTVHLSE